MHILEVASQVATLSEGLLAERTFEGPLACMLSEVVSQIAALLEHTSTARVLTFEIELDSLCLRILHSYSLVPLLRNSIESLRLRFGTLVCIVRLVF